jgi:hypothetical protein
VDALFGRHRLATFGESEAARAAFRTLNDADFADVPGLTLHRP